MTRGEEFAELRALLFAIAYRILGSVAEAEDAVQETWLRYQSSPTVPTSTKAFLSAVVTRVSIDVLRSARVRRETYVGQWLPEPLLVDPYSDPARSAELADSVSMAALLLLERLSALERAVFVLREVFGFFDAFREGDVDGLQELLAADVAMVGDGGGKAPQWPHGVVGAEKVARVLAASLPPLARIGVVVEPRLVNGQQGAIFRDRDGRLITAWTLDILDGQIHMIRAVLNPDKLGHLGPVADPWTVAREATQARRGDAAAPS